MFLVSVQEECYDGHMKKSDLEEFEVTISSWTVVRTVLILGLVALLWFLREIFLDVLTAIVLAAAFEPGIQFVMRRQFFRKHIPRLLSVVIIYAFGAIFLAAVFYFFVPAVIDDLSRIAHIAPKIIDGSGLFGTLPVEVATKSVDAKTLVTPGGSAGALLDNVQDVFSIFL